MITHVRNCTVDSGCAVCSFIWLVFFGSRLGVPLSAKGWGCWKSIKLGLFAMDPACPCRKAPLGRMLLISFYLFCCSFKEHASFTSHCCSDGWCRCSLWSESLNANMLSLLVQVLHSWFSFRTLFFHWFPLLDDGAEGLCGGFHLWPLLQPSLQLWSCGVGWRCWVSDDVIQLVLVRYFSPHSSGADWGSQFFQETIFVPSWFSGSF